MVQAIEIETVAVKAELGALGDMEPVKIRDGLRITADPGAVLYRFQCALDIPIPSDMPGQLILAAESCSCEVYDHDPDIGQLLVTARIDLGEAVPGAHLRFDPSRLLGMLQERLVDICEDPDAFHVGQALRFLSGRGQANPVEDDPVPGLNPSQSHAVRFAMGNPTAYVWGPPGTGKTRTLAHLVKEMGRQGERVMIAAHTNIATDNALKKFMEIVPATDLSILRLGQVGPDLAAAGVGLDQALGRRLEGEHPALLRRIEQLCADVAFLSSGDGPSLLAEGTPPAKRCLLASKALARLRDAPAEAEEEAGAILGELASVETDLVSDADVIATTLTSLFTSRRLHAFRTENAVIDEASVASLPQALCAAAIASERVVAFGDFMQLPTIVQTDHPQVETWLGRHVFRSARADDIHGDHPLRVMLTEQYRMHPQISRLVSETFYSGKLADAEGLAERRGVGPAVMLVDTTAADCRSTRAGTGSKTNRYHTRIVAALAAASGSDDIAVITPYRAQVRAIREVLREHAPEHLASGRIEVFTIHRYQGRDKDVVLFDTVEAPGTSTFFMDEDRHRDAPNLINVAMSRARKKLVMIASAGHLKNAFGMNGLLPVLFRWIRSRGGVEAHWEDEADRALAQAFMKD